MEEEGGGEEFPFGKSWRHMMSSLRKFTSFHNTSFANPFLQHLPDPSRIPDTKVSIFTMTLLIFTSFSRLIFTFLEISPRSNEKGF